MLPAHGFNYEQYQELMANPERHMPRLLNRIPSAPALVDLLLRAPIVQEEFKEVKLEPSVHKDTLFKALLLMHTALGEAVFVTLIRFQQVEAVTAFINYAKYDGENPPHEYFRGKDMQMILLCDVMLRLTVQCGGMHRDNTVRALLNDIHLPFYKHEAVYRYVTENVDLFKNTVH